MSNKRICQALEITRWIGVVIGFQLAFLSGTNPQQQLHIMTPWIVISLAGLTGIESLFFGKAASEITGYAPSAYQRQSGFNNLSIALTAIMVFLFHWGTYAEITIMVVLLVFLFLSACNHAWSAWTEHNLNIRNLLRPAMTIALVAFVLPCIFQALNHLE
ncbi:MAG: hypothetical protein K9N10_18050 [Deltaproteobacteria bacterium]|nr:hypothetical protein [Deltaproteobacteria bacterium]